jgi:hypothetical protein
MKLEDIKMSTEEKVINKESENKKDNKKSHKEIPPLTYNLSDMLDKLFPEYRPAKKTKEE